MSEQNKTKKSTIVLRTTLYIKGVEHIVETRKEIVPGLMDDMDINKLMDLLKDLVDDACCEHKNYWRQDWAKEK